VNVWWLIAGLGACTYALRIAGPMVLKRVAVPETAGKILNNIAPPVLSALVAAGMFSTEQDLVLDERAFGFVAAGLAVVAKLPPLVVIVVAAGATAAARAIL
jgi:branched-subunit amino acid transport protein